MRGLIHEWDDQEQALREWTTAQRAAFTLKQRVEKQRWERDVLAPAQAKIAAQIGRGVAPEVAVKALEAGDV